MYLTCKFIKLICVFVIAHMIKEKRENRLLIFFFCMSRGLLIYPVEFISHVCDTLTFFFDIFLIKLWLHIKRKMKMMVSFFFCLS